MANVDKNNHKAERKLVHTAHLDIRWADMDAFGHVNTSVYLTYFEQARVLQALRSPEHGMLHFAKGRHLYFSGRVTLEDS